MGPEPLRLRPVIALACAVEGSHKDPAAFITRTQYRRLTPVHVGTSLARQLAHATGMLIRQVLGPDKRTEHGCEHGGVLDAGTPQQLAVQCNLKTYHWRLMR